MKVAYVKKQWVNLRPLGCTVTIASAGCRRIGLHSSNVFADPALHVDYRDYLLTKHSFYVSFCGRANGYETLNANARIWTTSLSRTQKKRNRSLIPSLNQSRSWNVNQTKIRSFPSFLTLCLRMIPLVCPSRVLSPWLRGACWPSLFLS